MADPTESIDDATKSLQEVRPIVVVKEDVLQSIPTARDVIDRAFELDAKWSCHGKRIRHRDARNKV